MTVPRAWLQVPNQLVEWIKGLEKGVHLEFEPASTMKALTMTQREKSISMPNKRSTAPTKEVEMLAHQNKSGEAFGAHPHGGPRQGRSFVPRAGGRSPPAPN